MKVKVDMEHLHKDIVSLREDVALIKHILVEEGELTEKAKKGLEEARATPLEEYTDLEDL
jgi:hypothetical protein